MPNHSFEEYHYCNFTEFTTKEWYSAKETPDYFNPVCFQGILIQASEGVSYVGFFAYNKNFEWFREYIQIRLKNYLIRDKWYCISFDIAKRGLGASNGIGVLLTDKKTIDTIQNNNIFYNIYTELVVDTLLYNTFWSKINFEYKAKGNEEFLTIGNFFDNNKIIFDNENSNNENSYYYIDNVWLYECEEDTVPLEPPPASDSSLHYKLPNVISPNADGLNDAFVLESRGVKEVSVTLYNRWGELVQSTKYNVQSIDVLSKTQLWDATHNNKPAPQGVYYYIIELSTKTGEVIIEKGTVTVL